VLADASRGRCTTLRGAGDVLFRLGVPQAVLGGSLWAQVIGEDAMLVHGNLPDLDIDAQRAACLAVLEAFDNDCLVACHDIEDGGELVALAEMTWDRRGIVRCGAEWSPSSDVDADQRYASLFAETAGFLCAVPPQRIADFEAIVARHAVVAERRGVAIDGGTLRVHLPDQVVAIDLERLGRCWRHALEDVLETQEVVS
jgi:phosphoribosylformylglycinamidine synthase